MSILPVLPNLFIAHERHADAICQDAFQIDSTCYKVHKESVRWFTAVNRCLSYNASLAVFDDIVPEYFPSSLLSDRYSAWIGLVKSWWTWPGLVQLKLHDINLNDLKTFIWLGRVHNYEFYGNVACTRRAQCN